RRRRGCRLLLATLLGGLIFSPGRGQNPDPPAQAAQPTSDWKTYAVKGEEFSVQFPVLPAMNTTSTYLAAINNTESARKEAIAGTVVLRCVLASSGYVTNIREVSGLPNGLTERAIQAARQIKFVPAVKDGRLVSMWMELQYNFSLY